MKRSESDKIWENFCKKFDEAVFECAETGQQARLTIGMGERVIQIDISEAGMATKIFDEMALKAAKDAKFMAQGKQ